MEEAVAGALQQWDNFYVIVGSSGAALTGLQFVVIALSAEWRGKGSQATVDAFSTPTVVHFCAALLISSVLSAPWHGLSGAALILGATGAAGIFYSGIVTRRARRQTEYRPVLEDWVWHTALPFIAYATLLSAALVLVRQHTRALFAIAAAALLLLFIGIHNAWDAVIYIAGERKKTEEPER
jgi:hypothetical protein